MESIELTINKCEVIRKGDELEMTVEFTNEYGVDLVIKQSGPIETKKGFTGYYFKG